MEIATYILSSLLSLQYLLLLLDYCVGCDAVPLCCVGRVILSLPKEADAREDASHLVPFGGG